MASGIKKISGKASRPRQTKATPSPAMLAWPFRADVEEAGMEGDREGEAGEDEVGRVEQRVAEPLAIAEGARSG